VHLKKLRRAEGGAKIFGVFRVKNHDFTQKILIFPITSSSHYQTNKMITGKDSHLFGS
jgi:hypothetical protein